MMSMNTFLESRLIGNFMNAPFIVDGWSNKRNVPIMNFLVYSPRGTIFLKSRHCLKCLMKLSKKLDKKILSNLLVTRRLYNKGMTFFLVFCVAYYIDLMLENISNPRYFLMIDETITKVRYKTKFICNHAWVLALMRKDFINENDLCHPDITRFAAYFLSIQCLFKFKKEL